MTDEQLIEGCIKGKPDYQKALYEKYNRKLMGICLRYAIDEHEAHDMLQDGFIKIFNKLESYNGKGSLAGWLCRLVVNNCLDHLRRTKHQRKHVEMDLADTYENASSEIISKLSAQDILSYIQQLPSGYKTVFNMFAIEGYSHKEIAEELGVTENTSKSQYRKARLQLIKMIEENNKVLKRE
jgi:RNA polymerase sigma-70 factor (ECF subfamily)